MRRPNLSFTLSVLKGLSLFAICAAVTSAKAQNADAELKTQYLKTRAEGLQKVYQSYLNELDTLKISASKTGIFDHVLLIEEEIEVVTDVIKKMASGGKVVQLERFDDEKNQSGSKLRALKNRYHERIKKALSALEKQYVQKGEQKLKLLVKDGRIDDAKKLNAFLEELKGSGSQQTDQDLLADKDKWVEVQGDWRFGSNKVTGEGDSELLFTGDIPEEFVFSVDVKVLSGVRPRVYIGDYIVCNVGTRMQWVLYPKNSANIVKANLPWKHSKTYHIKVIYSARSFELFINDTLVEKRIEVTDQIKRLALSAGDYYSKGKVVFSNVRIR